MFSKRGASQSLIDAVNSVTQKEQKDANGSLLESGDEIRMNSGVYAGKRGVIREFKSAGRAIVQLHKGRQIEAPTSFLVSEKKMDPVDKKELKKKFKNRDDKDIDNDGDSDDSDEYLHNKRKTIKKSMDKKDC